ncbi:MAG: hypothetical protein JNJ47_04925, partial [Alphaproteobacteria bacterium]|nr:hypothetical protein [Alphaproteobacteria bacterium]
SMKSNNFIGICWFRLPISSDRFNWNIKTLERVIKKEIPKGRLNIEVVENPNGIVDVLLTNDGELNYSENVNFDIYWNGKKPFFDILSGFEYTELPQGNGLSITGIAPRVDHKKMIAWFRDPDVGDINILGGEVRTYEKN